MLPLIYMIDTIAFIEIFFGLMFMLSSLAIVVNRYSWEQILGDVEDNHLAVLLGGGAAIFVGLLTVTSVSYEEFGSDSLIAIVGWIALVKGVIIFLTPNWLIRLAHFMLKSSYMQSVAVFTFALGAVMLLIGFDVIG